MVFGFIPPTYRKGFGILFCLIGLTAITRSWLGMSTTVLHLWPILPLTVGIHLILYHKQRRCGSKIALGLGIPLTGVSLFLCCFSLELFPWSEIKILWPIVLLITGITFLAYHQISERKANLSFFILGWSLSVNAIIFLFFTYNLAPWNFWPYAPLLTGIWILAAQKILHPSITWTALSLVFITAGLFFIPFSYGWLSWSSVVHFQFILFAMLGIAFVSWYFYSGRRGVLAAVSIFFSLSFIMLLGPLLVGWDRFGWNLWPIMLLLIGGGLLSTYGIDSKTWAAMIPGTILLISGAFLWLFTSGKLEWFQMLHLWPTFPLSVGISFILASLARGVAEFRFLLWIGIILSLISILLYLFTLWPVGLLLVGFLFLFPHPKFSKSESDQEGISLSISDSHSEDTTSQN